MKPPVFAANMATNSIWNGRYRSADQPKRSADQPLRTRASRATRGWYGAHPLTGADLRDLGGRLRAVALVRLSGHGLEDRPVDHSALRSSSKRDVAGGRNGRRTRRAW